jgi:hypothetical protein
MADESYLCFSGVEIANACRTGAYAAAGLKPTNAVLHGCCCGDLAGILGDGPYTTPEADDAPWYDPSEPASAEFAGLLITEIEGIDAAPVERAVTNRIGEGAVIGPPRYGPRTITVTGTLIGKTRCSTDYGMRWLSSVLRGSLGCGPGACAGDDLEYMTCCPTLPGAGACACPQPCTGPECAEGVFRTLRDVAMIQEPRVVRRFASGCACCTGELVEVQFVLMAGRPFAYRAPVTVAEAVNWPPPEPDDECVQWSTDPGCMDEEAECAALEPAPCPLDPGCPPPVLPSLPNPGNPCICEPFTRREVCITIPPGVAPIWADLVPVLEVYAGGDILRNIRIRFYANPGNVPVGELDSCSWCSEINVSYLPAYGRLTLDSTTRRAMVQCPGRADTPASGIVSGPSGRPFQWPVLECGIPYTVCVSADTTTIADDAAVTLRTVVREV